MNTRKAWFIQAFCFLGVTLSMIACSGIEGRRETLQELMKKHDYQTHIVKTQNFEILSSVPVSFKPRRTMNIVIEGDGLAWVNRYTISDDPTPKNPVGLQLASHLRDQAVYLARPCQYVRDAKCGPQYWTSGRYMPEVLETYEEVLNTLKDKYGVQNFVLTGFSGGAYIASVLAARRDDIIRVNSVAGLVDLNGWTDFHDISPLYAPMTVENVLLKSRGSEFYHYCGMEDDVLPCTLAIEVREKAQTLGLNNHTIHSLSDAGHYSIWKNAVALINDDLP